MIFLFKGVSFRFHVSFRGASPVFSTLQQYSIVYLDLLKVFGKNIPNKWWFNFLMVMNPMVDLSFTLTEGANPSLRLRSKVP